MRHPDHKRAVRESFSRSAPQYDSVAVVQRSIAEQLIQGLPLPPASRVLDAGSGTGYVARLLLNASPAAQIHALDHAFSMCKENEVHQIVCGDLEALPFQSQSFDLYCSSLAWQWTDPSLAAAEAARVLRSGGQFAVATLGPANLWELAQAFAGIDHYPHVLGLPPAESYRPRLEAAGFSNIRIEHAALKTHSPDLRSLLKAIRSLGAGELGARRRPGLLGRHAWRTIEQRYEALRETQGLPLTYDALYLYARKT